jgi:hypothetical protein
MTTTPEPVVGVKFARCPDCQAVAWPGWEVTHRHRPPCRYEHTHPSTWSAIRDLLLRTWESPLVAGEREDSPLDRGKPEHRASASMTPQSFLPSVR